MYYSNENPEIKIDYSKPVKISESVFWIGHYDQTTDFQCNSYLVITGEKGIIIDPGSIVSTKTLIEKTCQLIDLKNISHIFITHQDPDVCGNIDQVMKILDEAGNNDCTIVTHQRTATFLVHLSKKYKMIHSNKQKYEIVKTGNNTEFEFINTPYLHSPGSMAIYYKDEKILFSSDLFGGFTKKWSLFAGENYFEDIKTFHQEYMPSKEILLYGMMQFEKLDIKMIAPQHGSVITGKNVGSFIKKFKNFECGLLIDEEFRDELKEAKKKIELQNRIMKEELLMAANFQKSLLPANQYTSFENEILISYKTQAQFSVSGDFVIIDQIDENHLAFMIIDVVGHGVTAGLATIQVKTLFDGFKSLIDPSKILREINKQAFNIVDNNSYFTALLCVFNAEDSSVKIASAAGIPPVFFDGNTGKHKLLGISGIPVGMSEDEEFSVGEIELKLKSNDLIILQTDGLIEAINDMSIQYDNALSQNKIKKIIDPKDYPKNMVDIVINDVMDFTNSDKFQDDFTIAVVKKL